MLTKELLLKINKPILITGEEGTGKTRLAKWIADNSKLRGALFKHVNTAAISENLFESEMFGHIKGSFTGASNNKQGFFESVGHGYLFLDEIGDLPLNLQVKLLTVIEQREFFPLGSCHPKKFDGQLIFATNKDLSALVKSGQFRKDLYDRIKNYEYKLTPLREREDLVYFFRNLFYEKHQYRLPQKCEEKLKSYSWPGNIRELSEVLDYIDLMFRNKSQCMLPDYIETSVSKVKKSDFTYYKEAFETFERNFLVDKLRKYHGMINETATRIKISKVTLISKIKKYDINIQRIKTERMVLDGI